MMCFPCPIPGKCAFSRDSKIKSLSSFDVGYHDYSDIGIAVDEYERRLQLNVYKRYILCEKNFTERDAFNLCDKNNLLSPHYKTNTRDGCALCPHAKKVEREKWFIENPAARLEVLKMQEVSKTERPGLYPLMGYKWFIEE